jgi:hypothetical protein
MFGETQAAPGGTSPSSDPIAAYRMANDALETAASSYASGRGTGPNAPTGATMANDAASLDRTNTDAGQAGESTRPVPFVDDQGKTVLGRDGKPMLRPAGLDPHFFVEQGLADRLIEDEVSRAPEGSDFAAGVYKALQLSHFQRGHDWDAQRIGGSFHSEFVDYSTVAIGLYAAAAGIPKDEILAIQNDVARNSTYPTNTFYDTTYSHLPEQNVTNTDLGYGLFRSGAIAAPRTP